MISLSFAVFVLGMIPGPAVFATVSRALSLKLRSTYLFILGILTGDFIFSFLAMSGYAVFATLYAPLFILLKIIGGAYLIFIGYNSLRTAKKQQLTHHTQEKNWKIFTSGFLLTASNPKDILFFVGFLPAFIDLEHADLFLILSASCTIFATFFVTLSFYALLANQIQISLRNSKYIHKMNITSGALMIGIGIYVLFY